MTLTNQEIYNYNSLLNQFSIEIKLPVRINFFLQKNIQSIFSLSQEIETARMEIGQRFGMPTPDGRSFQIPPENMQEAMSEIEDLFALKQEVNLHIFSLDDFEGLELTFDQMKAIMFMIEE